MNYVYMIHFAKPPRGNQGHYIGYTSDLAQRWQAHTSGSGAELTRIAVSKQIEMRLVRLWEHGTQALEIDLKQRNYRELCPLCMLQHAQDVLQEVQSQNYLF